MKRFYHLIILIFLTQVCLGQTVVFSDNMESTGWTWKGIPKTLLNSGYVGGLSATNDIPSNSPLYSSFDTCFRLVGTGTGSSSIEKDTLFYPLVTGLNPNKLYQISFKLSSIGITPSLNAAAGVDGSDYIQLEYSTNGTNYTREVKVVGASNLTWAFGSGTPLTKLSNNVLTSYIGPYSSVTLSLPAGATQFSFLIIMACNASGETWLIDDVELIEVSPLPIELLYFKAECKKGVCLSWSTQSEINNSYFTIYKSSDILNWIEIKQINGMGTTPEIHDYEFYDNEYSKNVVYYKLTQTDYDGQVKEYYPTSITCFEKEKKLIKIVNYLGQEVNENYDGLKYYIYE